MSNHYYFDSSGSDDEDPLPYPKPLPRSAFLTPEFSPTTFLSSLRNRHQTLEDLRSELRTRNQELSKELLDLVNADYQDFLGLGTSLRGGDEKIKEVQLGLLGFKREVETLKEKVEKRRKEVEALLESRRDVAREIRLGMGLLEVDSRLEELEESLRVGFNGANTDVEAGLDYSESEDESDEEDLGNAVPTAKLRRRVHQFLYIKRLIDKLGSDHPFLVQQEDRLLRIRQILLLDLNSALVSAGATDSERKIKILAIFRDMGESYEALQALREQR